MSTQIRHNPVVLLVEDDPDDQQLARLANRRLKHPYQLVVVNDGVEALTYLDQVKQANGAGDYPWPSFLLVDLNMPRMDGLSLLKRVRADRELAHLPVIVFTTSKAERDVAESYSGGCSSYIVKPMTISELVKVFETMANYWLDCVQLPS
ncbi:MAG: response regulator [Planctomycetota bacterium]